MLRAPALLALAALTAVVAIHPPSSEFDAWTSDATTYCQHTEDAANHKCYEGCASMPFKNVGLKQPGACNPHVFNKVTSTKNVKQCSDGVTNLKYCTAPLYSVVVTQRTKGEAAAEAMPLAVDEEDSVVIHGCGHTNLPKPDVGCPNHCEELSIPTSFKAKFMAASGWKYPKYSAGPCPVHFNAVESKWVDYDFPTSGVTHVKKGYAPPAAAMMAATKVQKNQVIGNQCNDVTADFSKEGKLDQVKEWWAANMYKYTSYNDGLCDPKKWIKVDHVESPIGVPGVVLREVGETGPIALLEVKRLPTNPRFRNLAPVFEGQATPLTRHFEYSTTSHCEEVSVADPPKSVWWGTYGFKYTAAGPCPSKYNFVNEKDHPAAGVTHWTKGIHTEVAMVHGAPVCGTGAPAGRVAVTLPAGGTESGMKVSWCTKGDTPKCSACMDDVRAGQPATVNLGADVGFLLFVAKDAVDKEDELYVSKAGRWPTTYQVNLHKAVVPLE